MTSRDRSFDRSFGRRPEVETSAPGRVNLIGEHTDYNGGLVLPTAIPQRTWVALGHRDDRSVRAVSREVDQPPQEYALGAEKRGRGWLDYVQGVTFALRSAGFLLEGFDLWLESDVPIGSGLSSSAALEVAVLRGLRELFRLSFDDVTLARLAQTGENDVVGAPVGILDPLASSLASTGSGLLIDTRTLAMRSIPIPAAFELIVISSGIAHSHASGEYGIRRGECERAARLLGVDWLSELTEEDLPRALSLPEPLGRRVRHVITENARVSAMVAALETAEPEAVGFAMAASHTSLRDDYEVSIPEIDRLVAIATADPEIVGARLTGGGFGGSIVALAREGAARSAASRIVTATGRGAVLIP